MEVLVNRAALNFGVPVSCWFSDFPLYTPMSGRALCSLAVFFRCFRKHHTRVTIGICHSAHQPNKAPFSPWPVLPACLVFTLFKDGPFDLWEVRLPCSADFPFRVAWLAKKSVCVFPKYIQEKTHMLFLAKCIIVHVFPLFMCFKDNSYLPPEICFLQFCLAFKYCSLPPLGIFLDESYHL